MLSCPRLKLQVVAFSSIAVVSLISATDRNYPQLHKSFFDRDDIVFEDCPKWGSISEFPHFTSVVKCLCTMAAKFR